MFNLAELGKLQEDASAFIKNAEKILADVAGSNGNVVLAIGKLAADFETIVSEFAVIKEAITDIHAFIYGDTAPATTPVAIAAPSVVAPVVAETTAPAVNPLAGPQHFWAGQ